MLATLFDPRLAAILFAYYLFFLASFCCFSVILFYPSTALTYLVTLLILFYIAFYFLTICLFKEM